MVKSNNIKIIKDADGGLPPMDESWWEAVLAEEEELHHAAPGGRPAPTASSAARLAARPAATRNDIAQVNWRKAQELYLQDQTTCLQVNGYNRGGLLVAGEGLQGFVPVSHLIDLPGSKIEAEHEHLLSAYVGRLLTLKVIECDQERGRVVFSERAALAVPGSRNQLLHTLKPGDVTCGLVTNVTDFGIFVDLGGIEGLVHVSEISWGRVRHPSEAAQLGANLQVYVINVDQDRSRVALSLKRLNANPWETAQERYSIGMVTEAVITSIVPFGAFARLEEGLDGLIHISELGTAEGSTESDQIYEGQRVHVRVLHVDASRQRLGLSLTSPD
jgi:small subunit ribosomal protein S1